MPLSACAQNTNEKKWIQKNLAFIQFEIHKNETKESLKTKGEDPLYCKHQKSWHFTHCGNLLFIRYLQNLILILIIFLLDYLNLLQYSSFFQNSYETIYRIHQNCTFINLFFFVHFFKWMSMFQKVKYIIIDIIKEKHKRKNKKFCWFL